MAYASVDVIQKVLVDEIFHHASDKKKAAGRSLGTIIEIITYYLLRQWGFGPYVTIELALPEFGNPKITHNVEFGLHPLVSFAEHDIPVSLPFTPKKIKKASQDLETVLDGFQLSSHQLLSKKHLRRNASVLGWKDHTGLVAIGNITAFGDVARVAVSVIEENPFALVECKRVGIEEGARKGPTTIEKAKQGAYVATHASSLQKIRSANGDRVGAIAHPDGSITLEPYEGALERLIYEVPNSELQGFVLTVGVASNHGNWFTAGNMNKELLVLQQSYDWLLFLTDAGLAEFVSDLILSDQAVYEAVRSAFLASYFGAKGIKKVNQFTKTRISLAAHLVLEEYFATHVDRIETEWFNVLGPAGRKIGEMKDQLRTLATRRSKV